MKTINFYFASSSILRNPTLSGRQSDWYETQETGHGRQDQRRYWILTDLEVIPALKQWPKITAIGCAELQHTVGLKTTTEKHYYLLSLSLTAQQFSETVRGHWGIENRLHWVLDVAFREDQSKVAQGYAPENLAVLRQIALNLLTNDKSIKAGTRSKRMRAGWDDQYLFKVLSKGAHANTHL